MFGLMNHLDLSVFQTATEALAAGYIYREPVKPIEITKVVVVKQGTVSGNSTIDIMLKNEKGEEFVCMITAKLLSVVLASCN